MHKITLYSNGMAVSCCTIKREHLSTRSSETMQCICCSFSDRDQDVLSKMYPFDLSVHKQYSKKSSVRTPIQMNNARKNSMQIETERIVPQQDSPIPSLHT